MDLGGVGTHHKSLNFAAFFTRFSTHQKATNFVCRVCPILQFLYHIKNSTFFSLFQIGTEHSGGRCMSV